METGNSRLGYRRQALIRGVRRAHEGDLTKTLAGRAADDIKRARGGLSDAPRFIGYAATEMEKLSRSGNVSASGLATQLGAIQRDLERLNKSLEAVHVTINSMARAGA